MGPPLRVWLVGALGLAVLSTAAGAVLRPAPPRGEPGLPDVAEVDSLAAYLGPGPATPRLDDYGAFLPARASTAAIHRSVPAQPSDATPDSALTPPHRLGGIILAGGVPLAFLDGEPVPRGAQLSDGSTVVEISLDHVVIRAPAGALRTLSLPHD